MSIEINTDKEEKKKNVFTPNDFKIDIRVGCNNFLIENITGFVGDDTVALTNFGVNGDYDMDPDIHESIIKNIHSFETGKCDIIRILKRGGFKIYNVQISNVVDLTPASDVGYKHVHHKVNIERLSALHFNNSVQKIFRSSV